MVTVEIDATNFDKQLDLTVDDARSERHTGAYGGKLVTKEYLISANTIADMDRYKNEHLPVGSETLTKYDAEPVIVTFDPDPVEGEWNYNHTFVAEFPSADAAQVWRNDETFDSAELEQLRQAISEEHNFFFASGFEPGLRVIEFDNTDHE